MLAVPSVAGSQSTFSVLSKGSARMLFSGFAGSIGHWYWTTSSKPLTLVKTCPITNQRPNVLPRFTHEAPPAAIVVGILSSTLQWLFPGELRTERTLTPTAGVVASGAQVGLGLPVRE